MTPAGQPARGGIDLALARDGTPGSRTAAHLNAAGSALPSSAVLAAVLGHLQLEARIGGYEAAEAAAERTGELYQLLARIVGGRAGDIALVESATIGWQRTLEAMRLRPGDRVLATASSYVSSAMSLLELRRSRGVLVEVIPPDATGAVDLARLEEALLEPTALVTAAHVPTSSGLVEPVAAVGALTRAAGVPFLLDATQSIGQLDTDVRAIGADALVGTGRKFLRGPRGTGFVWVDPALAHRLAPWAPDVRGARWGDDDGVELADGARRLETWEASHALRLGLASAAQELLRLGPATVQAHLAQVAGQLRRLLADVPGVRLSDPPSASSALVTFVLDGEEPVATARRLREAGVHVVAVPAIHAQWDLGRRGLSAVVRASVHVYNGDDDLAALADALPAGTPRRSVAPPPQVSYSHTAGPHSNRSAGNGAGAWKPDVVVVGAGVHGSAAAWQLARRGDRVLHLEQFPAGHRQGSSHGYSRMIRRAYPTAFWDDFVGRAYAGWDELAVASGRELVTVTGGLYAHPRAGGLSGPGCTSVDVQRAHDIFPGLVLEAGHHVVHDPAAGVIDAGAAMSSLAELGRAAGVRRRDRTPVLGWEAEGAGVLVHTSEGPVTAGRLVICAGPWTDRVLPAFGGLLRVERIVNVHVASSTPALLAPPCLGVFSVEVPDVGLLYGIPDLDGRGVKIGLDAGPPDDVSRPPQPVTDAERETLLALARRYLPAADGGVVEEVACRYTMAPKNRFAIGALPGTPQVFVAAACSGHGFKFGPAVGVALADLVHGASRPDLDALAPARMGVAALGVAP